MALANGYFRTPPVVKNLLIINIIVFMAQMLLPFGGRITDIGSLHFDASQPFMYYLSHSYQLVTYMFLHADWTHIFSNMFTLWMFGRIVETDMGSRRFFTYYMVSGIGAGVIQMLVNWITYAGFGGTPYVMTLGASGAVFSLLLAFAMFRPNAVIMMLFPPIPLKAKWFVLIYVVLELSAGVRVMTPGGGGGGVAHFAHLGGMLVGLLLLLYWKKKGQIY